MPPYSVLLSMIMTDLFCGIGFLKAITFVPVSSRDFFLCKIVTLTALFQGRLGMRQLSQSRGFFSHGLSFGMQVSVLSAVRLAPTPSCPIENVIYNVITSKSFLSFVRICSDLSDVM